MTLRWYFKSNEGYYYSFYNMDLTQSHFNNRAGVYIIFYVENNYIYTVYAGQGIIKDRIYAHRGDNRIQAYNHKTLYFTWADVSVNSRDGVEKYLHDRLRPFVRDRTPDVYPIEVNLPWD